MVLLACTMKKNTVFKNFTLKGTNKGNSQNEEFPSLINMLMNVN